ncbi:mitochondrial carrier domain-containing protein [Sporodiniella umbellata]|nr:mitochondrial carrier domain-containing protein [Sporodiniella umbellata]
MAEDYDYESLGQNATLTQDAMAGALAGIAEHCAMYPVDSIKTRMQVIPTIANVGIEAHPIVLHTTAHTKIATRHLWRGVGSVVMGAGPAHALYFATYEACKERFGANAVGQHVLSTATAGACATFVHDAFMNPFDVVKQRMQLHSNTARSVALCARQVYLKEGWRAFYVSLPTTLTMSVPFQSVQFSTYEYLRKVLNPKGTYDPKTHAIAGCLAGAFASSITTPLDVVKTLLQTRGQSNDPRIRTASGLWEAAGIIKERYGFAGFFRGFKPRVLTHMPSAAISWSVYEYFKYFISASIKNDESYLTL